MKIITYEMHNAPLIYSELTYDVGSKHEPVGQTGIAHAVEHMMFKGTKRYQKGTIAELISANGGVFNAFTSSDRTAYYELLPKNKIDLAFDIESERMHKCIFDEDEFYSEIKVILEERKMRTENSATGRRREELNTLIYKYHPYRNPIIGWPDDIINLTREQAYAYYQKYYTPNNATLVLVGDFETEAIIKKVEKYYGRIPEGPELPKARFSRVPQDGKKILEFTHTNIMQERISMYFSVPTRFSDDGPALYVAGKVLGRRGATSRLYKKLVDEKNLCKSAGAGMRLSKDPTTFSVSASLMPDATIEEVEKILWAEIDSLANTPVADYDLEKIKNKILFAELTDDQKPSSVGSSISLYENYIGWEYINQWDDMVLSVTKEDIMRVVKHYLSEENMVICYSFPDESKEEASDTAQQDDEPTDKHSDTTADDLAVMEISTDARSAGNGGFFAKLLGLDKKDVRSLYMPTIEDILSPNPVAPRVDSLTLQNGVPVYVIEDHDVPSTYLIGWIETGRLDENWQRPGIRLYTTGMLQRGTKNRTFEEIVEERSFTPFQFDVGQSWNNIWFQGYCLSKDTDKMLSQAYEILVEPSFPEEEMEKLRPRMVKSAEDLLKTETMKAFYAMFNHVFIDHQYSVRYAGEADVLKSLTRQDLVDYYDKYYSPDNMKILVVGDFTKDGIKEQLDRTLGNWVKKSGDENLPFTTMNKIAGKSVYVFNNPDYKQCRVDIAFNPLEGGIVHSNPDLVPLEILSYILSGSTLTSRMGIKLRDEQGLCYNIKNNKWIRANGGYWGIRTKVDKENVQKMIRGIFDEIELIQKESITDEELLKAKSRKIGLLPLHIRTADDIGGVVFTSL
ncbi:MAG: insulinase family protein, partial [Candidatus Marinimicrobia bacterium]|nr:insulinase family protein [Candidatus Neomarinimicrobiota bacterium]